MAAGPLSVVALIAGWITTEVGRQPWIVYDVMRVDAAVTGANDIPIGYGTLTVVYVIFGVIVFLILRRLAGRRCRPLVSDLVLEEGRGAYVPVAFILAGMTAYTVLAGADFGAGLWTLLAVGRSAEARRIRDEARHAMGPVWEANHVWLIFVLVIAWTAYPVAYGSITSTLAAPLLIAAIGIIFRGAAYALRGALDESRFAEYLFALSSVLTPFALGTAVGAIATGRVPVGNALGNPVTSWLNPASVLIGALAVVFSGYLAAVYLAADSLRHEGRAGSGDAGAAGAALANAFRRRALAAGLVCGALALAGLLVMRHSGLNLTHGDALALVCVSAAAGLATLLLCWWYRFGLARVTAALAVAAVVVGWAAGQAPRFLPGLTVTRRPRAGRPSSP